MRRDLLACAILINVVVQVLCAVHASLGASVELWFPPGRDTLLTAGVTQFQARVAAVHLDLVASGCWCLLATLQPGGRGYQLRLASAAPMGPRMDGSNIH